jgi:hypothetical protein
MTSGLVSVTDWRSQPPYCYSMVIAAPDSNADFGIALQFTNYR